FGPMNSPYQFLPIGTKENVQSFAAEQMRQWYTQKILPAHRVIAIFGDVSLQDVKQTATKYLRLSISPANGFLLYHRFSSTWNPQRPEILISSVEAQTTEQALAGIVIGFHSF